MSFTSYQFPLFFLLFVIVYYLLPWNLRRIWLLVASCFFYIVAIPAYLLILFALIVVDFAVGILLERFDSAARKRLLVASLGANLGMLFVFKYFDFFVSEATAISNSFGFSFPLKTLQLVLPIGLSFHTFQSLSYVFEVYYRRQKAERNLVTYALYVLFWPQLVAGPIERPQSLLPQLSNPQRFNPAQFSEGARLMLLGFIKKLVIADRLAMYVDSVYASPTEFSGLPLILATYCFAFQIYCDFSGYTDIARGAAKVLGMDLMKNFNFPYLSQSVSEFWRRWHISLSLWFRDYVYIPLGGSRGSEWLTWRNLLIVFVLSGFWHGANWTFLVWGALHGLYLVAGRALNNPLASLSSHTVMRKAWPLISWFATFNLICFAWIFFRANSISDAWHIVTHLFATSAGPVGWQELAISQWAVRMLLVGSLIALETAVETNKLPSRLWKLRPVRWTAYYFGIALIITFGILSENQFIYFQF